MFLDKGLTLMSKSGRIDGMRKLGKTSFVLLTQTKGRGKVSYSGWKHSFGEEETEGNI